MKRFCVLHRHFQWRNLTVTALQRPPEIDHTIASIQFISSNPCFSLLGICKTVSSLRNVHALLVVHGLSEDIFCETKLVSLYGSFGHVECARSVFDRIPNPDLYSWKVMIRWYFLNDSYSEIVQFYNTTRLRKCLNEYDNVVFSIVLKACSELREIDEGRKLHCRIVKVGSPDSFVLTGLVDMYAKCREIEDSRQLFDEIPERNVVCWTSMIVGYIQNDCLKEGLLLFNKMREGLVEGNQYTLGSLVTACAKLGALHQGKGFHGYVIKSGFDLNSFLVTSLLDLYSKCGEIRNASSVFYELSTVDLVSWTAMIVGYAQRGHPKEALKLFTDKRWKCLLPNTITTSSVLSACAQTGYLTMGRSVHGLGIKLGLKDATFENALIDMYAKCHMIGDAWCVFETVFDKDVIAWNSIISGYSQNGYTYEALELFHRMRLESVSPDAVTLVGVLSACASVGGYRAGISLHGYCMKAGLLSGSVYVGTALLNFYAKCGDAECARLMFDEMEEKNSITWSAMIGCYGIQGDCSRSLELFGDMLKEKLEPNEVIFTTILSACSHSGMLGEGSRYFNTMCKVYNIVPSMKHYACMVDLLARAGRLEEALDFIEKIPIQPDVSLLGAFLHGCRLHSRLDLGEVVVRRMLELHPDKACYYVLMSNLYASEGKWDDANQVMELMKQRGLAKLPGWSQVEMETGDDFSPLVVASYS